MRVEDSPVHDATMRGDHYRLHAVLCQLSGEERRSVSNSRAEDDEGREWFPLELAARGGHAACLDDLLSCGAQITCKSTHNGDNLLHCAAWHGHAECINLLLQRGLHQLEEVNATSNNGWTPLHCAAHQGGVECARLLIIAGADCELPETYGERLRPLDIALRRGFERTPLFALLQCPSRALLDHHLRELREAGFTVLPPWLACGGAAAAAAGGSVDALLEALKHALELPEPSEALAQGLFQKRTANLLERSDGDLFARVALNPFLLRLARELVGPDAVLSNFSANTLYPVPESAEDGVGDDAGWHVDSPYCDVDWGQAYAGGLLPRDPPALGAQFIIALDGFTVENGATHAVKGGYREYRWPTKERREAKKAADGEAWEERRMTCARGSAIVAHAAWWHRQGRNTTAATRSALVGAFTDPHYRPKDRLPSVVAGRRVDHPLTPVLRDAIGLC